MRKLKSVTHEERFQPHGERAGSLASPGKLYNEPVLLCLKACSAVQRNIRRCESGLKSRGLVSLERFSERQGNI